ncbi:MAG: D-sedoheptulose-7-phosphate isomerase [Desulfobacterales bacterium]
MIDNQIERILESSLEASRLAVETNRHRLKAAVDMLAACLASGHKILIFGNGGSAADSQHIAAEFVNRFRIERPPLAAIALTTDASVLTSIGNDYAFDEVFEKQIRALARPDDVAWGISTSGNSENVVRGIRAAADQGLRTLASTGPGGRLAEAADLVLSVPSESTPRIQEAHILMAHMLCELVDRVLYPERG